MKLNDPISKVMISDVLTLGPENTMSDVADVFDRKHIHHIPIVENDLLVGLISKSDFLFYRHDAADKASADKERERLSAQKIGGVMHKNLASLKPDDTIEAALIIFRKNYFHAIPISDNQKLIGILTPLDIVEHLLTN